MDDTGEFLSVVDCKSPIMYVLHLSKSPSEAYRMDYVTPFTVMNPVLSMKGVWTISYMLCFAICFQQF